MVTSSNPFAPPTSLDEPPVSPGGEAPPRTHRSVTLSLAVWSFVCIASAAPSFVWGLGTIAGQQIPAMCLGIAIFIALYTAGDQWTQSQAWRKTPQMAKTLKIGYATRVVISVIFPIGAGLDMFCGLFSTSIVGAITPLASGPGEDILYDGQINFIQALLITLTQGVILNIVLLAYMLVVLGVLLLSKQLWSRPA
ncbi:MAG: hypothetical protein KDA45_13370 [Planctomycetales bacterium]|nr:hypothetical protein [Planctomycetales bacterium]